MSQSAELPAIFHRIAAHRHLIVPIGFATIGVWRYGLRRQTSAAPV